MPSRSIDPPATATLPFISDESRRTHQTQRTNSSFIAAGKSKAGFKAVKIGAVLLLLVMALLQNFRALFLHHQHLQNDDRYKEELMDLPILEDESSSSSNKLGNSLEDIDTANKAAVPIHHSTADEDVSVEEEQKQKDVSVEEADAKKDGVDIAKNAAAHIQVSLKDNENIIITGKDVSRSIDVVDTCDEGYLKMNPDVAKAVEEGKFQSGLQHWREHGEREGRTPYCLPSIERPFVFFHNRKCGGSTLRAGISTAARRHNIANNTLWIPCHAGVDCKNFDNIPRDSYRAIYASHINYEDVVRARRQINSTKLAGKKDFLGQMILSSGRNATYYHLNNHHQHFSCLTNIRDTISRVVSCYNFRFLQNGSRMASWEMPNTTEMTADDWTVLLPQAYDKYSGGCNNEMLRTYGSLNDETMINTLTRNSPFFESELRRAKGRMAQCIIVDLDRCKESNAVLRFYLPWLGNGLDLCSERKNVGLIDRDPHIQKGSAEAILTLNEFDAAMFQFGTELFEHQLQNAMGPKR